MSAGTHKKSYHTQRHGYWLYGRHPVLYALKNARRDLLELLFTEAGRQFFIDNGMQPSQLKVPHKLVTNEAIQMLLPYGVPHQGVALNTKPLPPRSLHGILDEASKQAGYERSIVLICDQITDPHNFGAIIRTSVAFGVHAIVVPERNQALESASVAKAACGMLEVAPIATVVNVSDSMRLLKDAGYWTIGLDATATSKLEEAEKFEKVALVLGGEGEGMRRLTVKNCDLLVRIPMSSQAESLNVSTAAAVALYGLAARYL